MMASRFLMTFEAEVTGWQRAFATVAEALLSLADVQRKWSYLEPLFIGSDEVRRELPAEAVRFEGIDARVRALLRTAGSTRNIRDACNAPGIFGELEQIQSLLDQCEKALAEFLDVSAVMAAANVVGRYDVSASTSQSKKKIFPRFYFVSTSDLLDLLSNGSSPRDILRHIPKVFLSTDTILFENDGEPNLRPTAHRWISGVGE